MNIAVVGASGLIGRGLMKHISKYLKMDCQIVGTYHKTPFIGGKHIDITSQNSLNSLINELSPQTIIWLSGSKELKLLELNSEVSTRLNETPIDDIIDIITKREIKPRFIYISSDYVFDGIKGNYSSDEPCCPDTVYGKSKVYAESKLRKANINYVSLRTSAVMSLNGGFLGWLIKQNEGAQVIELFENTIFSPTPSISLCKAVAHIINSPELKGVMHFAGEATSRYDFGRWIISQLGGDTSKLIPISADITHSTFHKDLSLKTSSELLLLKPKKEDMLKELLGND